MTSRAETIANTTPEEFLDFLANALVGRGSQAEAVCLRQHLGVTRFSRGQIHQNVEDWTTTVWIRVWNGTGMGWASTNDLTSNGLSVTAELAEANSRGTKSAQIELPSTGVEPIETFFDTTASIADASARAAIANQCLEVAGHVELNANLRVATQDLSVVNTAGLRLHAPMTYAAMNAVARNEFGSTWYDGAIGRDSSKLDFAAVAETATQGAVAAGHPVRIADGEMRAILDPAALSMLLVSIGYVGVNAFGAGAVAEGRSFVGSHIGEAVASDSISLVDDPLDTAALNSAFDAEGTKRQIVPIIENGVAVGVGHDLTSAARSDVTSTGSALPVSMKTPSPHSLSIPAGTSSREQLVDDLSDGIIINRIHPFISLRGGPEGELSGTTRDGVLVVRSGEVVGSAVNVRWSNNMTDLLRSVEGVSEERSVQWMDLPDHSPHTNHVPSLLCGRFIVHGSQPRE